MWGEYDIENGIYHSEQGEGYPNKLSGMVVRLSEGKFFYKFEVDIKKSSSTVQSLGFDYYLVGSSGVQWEIGLWAKEGGSHFVAHLEKDEDRNDGIPSELLDTQVLGPVNLNEWYSLSIIIHDNYVTMGINGYMTDLFSGLFSRSQEEEWSGVEIKGIASYPSDVSFWLDNIKVYSLPVVAICEGDFDHDGDVDGSDLAAYIIDSEGVSLEDFAAEFSRTDCFLVQITTHPDSDGSPAWSPNSPNNSKIAFSSDRSGTWSIWVMNIDGTDEIKLTDNLGHDVQPHWRTDGAKLVFHSNRSGNWDIWMVDSDGSNLMQLTDDPANDFNPDFSPDGSAIIFESDRNGNYDIWTMDSDGVDPAQITSAPEYERNPHFSHDGSKIVYKSDKSDNYDIWTMDNDGSNAVQLTNSLEKEGHPHFSPDGSKIVFWSERTGNREVWMMNTDGSEQTQFTDNPANDGGANWSSDGDKIIFRSDRAGNDDIWIYNLW